MESYDVIVIGSGASACHTEGVGQGFKRDDHRKDEERLRLNLPAGRLFDELPS
jgi:hypothetical protein